MKGRDCSNCRFIHVATSHKVECRRFPPNHAWMDKTIGKNIEFSEYPIVYNYKLFEGMWQSPCGEHQNGNVDISIVAKGG